MNHRSHFGSINICLNAGSNCLPFQLSSFRHRALTSSSPSSFLDCCGSLSSFVWCPKIATSLLLKMNEGDAPPLELDQPRSFHTLEDLKALCAASTSCWRLAGDITLHFITESADGEVIFVHLDREGRPFRADP